MNYQSWLVNFTMPKNVGVSMFQINMFIVKKLMILF